MKESYSQMGEDLVVDHYLSEPPVGTYLDIGAYDPIFLSNTYLFYKRGWKGICVEPNPLKYNAFREDRPNDTFFGEACGQGQLKFTLNTAHDSLSSCTPDGSTPIKTRTLKEYLSMLPAVDLLSVDCEGMELDILESNDWNVYRPNIVVVEIIDYETKVKNEKVIQYLKDQGYGLVCDNQINAVMLEETLYNRIFKTKLR